MELIQIMSVKDDASGPVLGPPVITVKGLWKPQWGHKQSGKASKRRLCRVEDSYHDEMLKHYHDSRVQPKLF
ncbi:hypothetical protein ACLOJK_019149 [Asimina triloba]